MKRTTVILLLCLLLLAFFLLACDDRDSEGQHPVVNATEEGAGQVNDIMLKVLRWGNDWEQEHNDN